MSASRRRPLTVGAVGGVALALLTGALSASGADYSSDITSIGTSPSSPWTATSAGVATVVGDGARGSVLQLTSVEGATSRLLHYLTSGTFPTVDAAYEARSTWGRFIDGGIDPDSTLPRAEAATAQVIVDGGAQLFLDMELSYLDADGERRTTVMTCALPATESWSAVDLSDCNYHVSDWKLTSWMTTEEWSYRTDKIELTNHTYPAGAYISGVSNGQASAYPVAIGFRVEGPAGATARIDDFVIRDSALSFTASPTTLVLTVTTSGAAVPGVAAVLSATVSPSTAQGTVRFSDGATLVSEGSVVDGAYSAMVAGLGAGAHTLTASFLPADEGAFAGSSSTPVTLTVSEKQDPAAPPAANTDELLALPGVVTMPSSAFTPTGGSTGASGSLDGSKPLSGEVPWTDASDSFVDVYGYSSPIYLGTFPVVNGVVQLTGLDLSALPGGGHHLVFVGQTSATVVVMAVSITAALAATGTDVLAPSILASVLLVLGLALLVVRRRRA